MLGMQLTGLWKSILLSAGLAVPVGLFGPSVAEAEDTSGKAAVMSSAEELKWTMRENGPPIAYVWGDATSGPHAEFVKFPPQFSSPVHMHTEDYHGVVVSGTMMNPMGDATTGPELTPGPYYFVPGGQKHVTKCISETPCVFYLHQDAAFDLIPVQ